MPQSYREILGKQDSLQRGFTSGSCACAVSMGGLLLLLGKIKPEDENALVSIKLPKGIVLPLPLTDLELRENSASCTIIKDSGDDEDITHGTPFCATVSWSSTPGIQIRGGMGVGKVTRPGLPLAVGEWAINPGPRKMIHENLEPLIPEGKGVEIIISIPKGEELARKTWNSRIGIEGGLSIIGTSGIIEPRSSSSYKASIALMAKSRKVQGAKQVYLTPGYVGEGFYKSVLKLEEDDVLRFGDHAGFALTQGASKAFEEVHLACHIGKMAKIAAGLFNTHCKSGDARLETVAALAGAAGASSSIIRKILSLKMAEEAVSIIEEESLEECYTLMEERCRERIHLLWKKSFDTIPDLHIYILDLQGSLLNS